MRRDEHERKDAGHERRSDKDVCQLSGQDKRPLDNKIPREHNYSCGGWLSRRNLCIIYMPSKTASACR